MRARIEYLIAYGPGDYRLDPHNPRHVEGPPASEFVTPGYEPPRELVDPSAAPAGMVTEDTVEGRALGGVRCVIVYTPSSDHEVSDAPVAVFLDTRSGEIARVLDWLTRLRRGQQDVRVGRAAPHPTRRSSAAGASP